MAAQYPPLTNSGNPDPDAPADTRDATAAKPCPAQQPRGVEPDIDVDALWDRIGDDRQPPDLIRDVLWTYGALENRQAKPDDAPSLGAWSLLCWARQYRNRFFEKILPKAMLNRPPEDGENQRQEKKEHCPNPGHLRGTPQGLGREVTGRHSSDDQGGCPKSVDGLGQSVRVHLARWRPSKP